jgi:hypothetical protein
MFGEEPMAHTYVGFNFPLEDKRTRRTASGGKEDALMSNSQYTMRKARLGEERTATLEVKRRWTHYR